MSNIFKKVKISLHEFETILERLNSDVNTYGHRFLFRITVKQTKDTISIFFFWSPSFSNLESYMYFIHMSICKMKSFLEINLTFSNKILPNNINQLRHYIFFQPFKLISLGWGFYLFVVTQFILFYSLTQFIFSFEKLNHNICIMN